MVKFRGRRADIDVESSVDMEEKRATITAPVEVVKNAMASVVNSDQFSVFTNFQTESIAYMDEVDEAGDRPTYKISNTQRFSGMFDDHDRQGEKRGEYKILMEQMGDETVIRVEDNLIREDPTTDKTSIGKNGETYGTEAPLELIRDSPKKVALGYGITHPLDVIQPTSIDKEIRSMEGKDVVDLFSDWIAETIKRTQMDVAGKEHGFYVDGADNVVGIVEGKLHSIAYPPRNTSTIQAQFHTHPEFTSVAVPSGADVGSCVSTSVGAVHMVSVAGHNTWFGYDREKYEGRNTSQGYGGQLAAFRPFSDVPVTIYRVIDAGRIPDKEQYIDEFVGELKDIVRFNTKHKIDIVNATELTEEIKTQIRSELRERSGNITDALDEGEQGSLDTEEQLRESIEQRGRAIQLSRSLVEVTY